MSDMLDKWVHDTIADARRTSERVVLRKRVEELESMFEHELSRLRAIEDSQGCIDKLRAELAKVYDAIGSTKYVCPRCGGRWFVPDALVGDPRFDCPHCEGSISDGEIKAEKDEG